MEAQGRRQKAEEEENPGASWSHPVNSGEKLGGSAGRGGVFLIYGWATRARGRRGSKRGRTRKGAGRRGSNGTENLPS